MYIRELGYFIDTRATPIKELDLECGQQTPPDEMSDPLMYKTV